MPLTWFRCPDNELTPFKDCIKKCRLPERCEPLPYLYLASDEREWTGVASTTQLLNGTMYSFLKITQPYIINPDDMAFAIHGTLSHGQLEEVAKKMGLTAELSTTLDDRNVIDLLEYEDRLVTLTDYKTWGSYRVAKALGIVEVGKRPDPTGATYKSSGSWGKAGSPKMVTIFQQTPSKADNWEAEMQLNRYRIMMEARGIPISKMRVHVIVRDGGLAVSRSRGVERNTYIVPVKRLSDNMVYDYFQGKAGELNQALSDGKWDMPCNNRECWDSVRCREYCEVATYCSKGLLEQGGR